jgi:hypothetical protein
VRFWFYKLMCSYFDDAWANAILQGANTNDILGYNLTIHTEIIGENGRIYVGP